MDSEHHRKLENMYLNAKINKEFYESTKIDIASEKARIEIDIEDKYFHALGAIHGSVYFKLLDDAAFFAVNSIVTEVFVLTTNFNLQFIRPASEGKIFSEGKVVFKSQNLFVAESKLYHENGKIIGFGSGNFMKSKTALSADIGYK